MGGIHEVIGKMRLFFSPVERMLAARYVRSRRAEGFISVIAWFSLAGITLGVATLIIVMSVMNGFRAELIGRILGLNGHIAVYAAKSGGIDEFDRLVSLFGRIAYGDCGDTADRGPGDGNCQRGQSRRRRARCPMVRSGSAKTLVEFA